MPGISLTFNNKDNKKFINIFNSINKKLSKKLLLTNNDFKLHITLMYISKDLDIKLKDIDDNYQKINNILDMIKNKYNKFKIKITGLGIFRKNNNYILYFNIPYSIELQNIHKDIWKNATQNSIIIDPEIDHYSPKNISIHMTIPILEPSKENIITIMNELLNLEYDVYFDISNITYLTGNLNNPKVYLEKSL